MKIYTRKGDDGTTSLFGGDRLSKADIRVEAYGTVDELNSFVGLLIDYLTDDHIRQYNQKIQHILFNLGSIVATVDEKYIAQLPQITPQEIVSIESEIDQMEVSLPPMTNFVLPSGHHQVSLAHICRTVCRRAERGLVRLYHVDSNLSLVILIQFLNRLSDYYFVLARKLTQLNAVDEVIWKKETTL